MIDQFLKDRGYSDRANDPVYGTEYGVVYWYKKVPGADRQQFVVRQWPKKLLNGLVVGSQNSYEVEMSYETDPGECETPIWAETKFYGLSTAQLELELERLENRLRVTVSAMGGNPKHYHYDGE